MVLLEFRKPQRPEYVEARLKALMLLGKLLNGIVIVFPALYEPRERITQLQRAKSSHSAKPMRGGAT